MNIFQRIINSRWQSHYFPKYPRVEEKDFARWNEEMFKKYTNERIYNHPNPLIRIIERKRVNLLLKDLGNVEDSDYILAAGSGEGYIEKQILKGKIAIVDISKEAISRAKKNLKNRENCEFYIANLEKLPFANSTFEKIECSEVIEHVYSPDGMMKEFSRVLKPEGALVITFPNEPLINFIKKIFIRLRLFTLFFPNIPQDMTEEWHLRAFDYNRFRELTDDNWKIVHIAGTPFNFFPLRYIVKCKKV